VYCYHGNSSLGAVAYFLENGFKNAASMSGGFEAWRQVYEHEAG
jgi:thiosulfate sulfurtransferase